MDLIRRDAQGAGFGGHDLGVIVGAADIDVGVREVGGDVGLRAELALQAAYFLFALALCPLAAAAALRRRLVFQAQRPEPRAGPVAAREKG